MSPSITVLVSRGVAKSGTSRSWQKRRRTAGGRIPFVTTTHDIPSEVNASNRCFTTLGESVFR